MSARLCSGLRGLLRALRPGFAQFCAPRSGNPSVDRSDCLILWLRQVADLALGFAVDQLDLPLPLPLPPLGVRRPSRRLRPLLLPFARGSGDGLRFPVLRSFGTLLREPTSVDRSDYPLLILHEHVVHRLGFRRKKSIVPTIGPQWPFVRRRGQALIQPVSFARQRTRDRGQRTNPILPLAVEGFDQGIRRLVEGHPPLRVIARRPPGCWLVQDADPLKGLAEARKIDLFPHPHGQVNEPTMFGLERRATASGIPADRRRSAHAGAGPGMPRDAGPAPATGRCPPPEPRACSRGC